MKTVGIPRRVLAATLLLPVVALIAAVRADNRRAAVKRIKTPMTMAALVGGTAMVLLADVGPSRAQSPPTGVTLSRSASWSVFGYDPAADFKAFDPQYRTRINQNKDELEQLGGRLYAQGLAGRQTPCGRQIYVEAHWLIHSTAYYDRIAQRLKDLRAILQTPSDPSEADQQSPLDGSFNRCAQPWFYKVDSACDQLVLMKYTGERPKYPLRFLDQINSPEKYRAYMDSVLISDVSHTGVDTRFELNIGGTDLVRLISGELPTHYTFHPELKATMLDYLDQKWQDPATGFWGCWYKTKDGNLRKTADLSMTFHVVHYRHGQVRHWPQIIQTTLAMKDLEYPFGWMQEGRMSDHHNYDVALLFHLGWPSMTPAQKVQARTAIQAMLHFCLTQSLRPDGSFDQGDENTIGEAYEFPVLFLYEIGYFSKANRFWTTQDFPQSHAVARRIVHKIKQIGLTDPETQTALLILEAAGQAK